MNQRVVRALHRELVGCADEGQAGEPGDLRSGGLCEVRCGIDARANGGAAEGEAVDALQCIIEPFEIVRQRTGKNPTIPARG